MPKLNYTAPVEPLAPIQPQKTVPLANKPFDTRHMGAIPMRGMLGNPAPPHRQNQQQQAPGWLMGINIASQYANDPAKKTQLAAKQQVTAQPQSQVKPASYNKLDRMTDILSTLVIKPPPDSIMQALGLR